MPARLQRVRAWWCRARPSLWHDVTARPAAAAAAGVRAEAGSGAKEAEAEEEEEEEEGVESPLGQRVGQADVHFCTKLLLCH